MYLDGKLKSLSNKNTNPDIFYIQHEYFGTILKEDMHQVLRQDLS